MGHTNTIISDNTSPDVHPGTENAQGDLIIIGGKEEKSEKSEILREAAARVHSGKLVIATVASGEPEESWEEYRKVFSGLGVKRIEHLSPRSREDALGQKCLKVVEDADVVFFTGGDQVRITSVIGGTQLCDSIRNLYVEGGAIAGTSSGASAMSDTMLAGGEGDESHKLGSGLMMAPGLGLLPGVIIDQHFAERGRIGRLLAAVAHNPRILGLGIDENTAIAVKAGRTFRVIGAGAVYVLDGAGITGTNVSTGEQDGALSVFHVVLHQLSKGDSFDLMSRSPALSADASTRH